MDSRPGPHRGSAVVIRSRLVARVGKLPAGQTFTASWLAAEVNRRFGHAFRRPVDSRLVGAALRCMATNGTARVVQPGTSHRETVYARAWRRLASSREGRPETHHGGRP